MSAMYLRLSLPPRADAPSPGVETRPAELERWLAGLPILNTAETTQLVSRQLLGLNRTVIDDPTRVRLLELFRAPVHALCQELPKAYLGLPQPLPDRARQVANQVRLLLTEMAYGYKLIAFNSTAIPKIEDADKPLLTLVLHRGIRYLTEQLFRGYELYSPPAEGVWYEIHQLYRYAELLGITDAPVDDPLNTLAPHNSISAAYKQALLLDFSDPFHLPGRMLAKISRYLDRYAALAQLSPGIVALKSQCQFLINLDNDRAGAVNTEASPITTEVRYRLLNTTDLARLIHQQLLVLQAGQTPDPDGLEKDFFVQFGQDLLVRMIQAWGVNPKRVYTRTLRENVRHDIVFGVDAINYFVNGGERFKPSTNEVGPTPRSVKAGTSAGAAPRTPVPETAPASSAWDLIDESAGGYALTRSGGSSDPVRVGDLLASRPQGGRGWEIGVVRWVRTSGVDNVEMGVQRLSPAVAAVAVLPIDDHAARYALALELPEVKPMKQPATLITERGCFKPNRIFSLDNGYRTRQIKAFRLVELTGAFERFQYEYIDR